MGRLSRLTSKWTAVFGALVLLSGIAALAPASRAAAYTSYQPRAFGELDCNGFSPVQKPVHKTAACTDVRGFSRTDNEYNSDAHFYDNGHYIGHDEPDVTFLSSAAGSGNDVTWTERLGRDPSAAPTVSSPGSDVAHNFELTVAPWFSMALCDPNSNPLLPCTPNRDANAPAAACLTASGCQPGDYPGAGSAFMELQFYPPGLAPFVDSISCDNTHWCAALTLDSLECTYGFAQCNPNCIEPANFAWIQTTGVPTGPPSPQDADLNTFTPNSNTLLMNPGDQVKVQLFDGPASGGGRALTAVVTDLTTHHRGFMQASAANGFQNTSIVDCSGTPYNFEPEYNTAEASHIVPWAALQTDVSTEFEIGHFEACTRVTDRAATQLSPRVNDIYYQTCHGPYESAAPGGDGGSQPEVSDAPCYKAGDTHGLLNTAPDTLTGCGLFYTQNGDLDFDGSAYWTEWPTGTAPTARYPGSFVQNLPTTGGAQYPSMFIQTDAALSESTCSVSPSGCALPPPGAPGHFYPFWSQVPGSCALEFGNVTTGVNDFGRDAGYGTNQFKKLGYDEFEGPVRPTSCS